MFEHYEAVLVPLGGIYRRSVTERARSSDSVTRYPLCLEPPSGGGAVPAHLSQESRACSACGILRAIVDIAVYSKQRRIERIVKDDESSIRDDTRDCPVIAQICQGLLVARMSH